MVGLKYVGNGDYILNIPKRDLTEEEIEKYGGEDYLIGSGNYVRSGKSIRGGRENKMILENGEVKNE